MPELIAPDVVLHRAWLEGHAEWGPGRHEDGFGLDPADDVHSPEGFALWVARLGGPDRVHRWIVEDGRVLGGIALRYGDDDYIRWAGHIGFGIRPSARGRGLGAWALSEMLHEARGRGLTRILAVCVTGNAASARTIERCGGIFEGVQGDLRRYGIAL